MFYENNSVSRAPGQPAGIFRLNEMLQETCAAFYYEVPLSSKSYNIQ